MVVDITWLAEGLLCWSAKREPKKSTWRPSRGQMRATYNTAKVVKSHFFWPMSDNKLKWAVRGRCSSQLLHVRRSSWCRAWRTLCCNGFEIFLMRPQRCHQSAHSISTFAEPGAPTLSIPIRLLSRHCRCRDAMANPTLHTQPLDNRFSVAFRSAHILHEDARQLSSLVCRLPRPQRGDSERHLPRHSYE
jgi:hypothetical protein